jgi:hypothetical protein
LAHLNSCWSKDVALFAIGVKEQGQSRIAMGVVVDRSHFRGYAVLVAAEIHQAVQPLMRPVTSLKSVTTRVRVPGV